ncbi:MAG: hypothetical protein BroJett018_27180 [Chloroflexota bacterium]|nr:MAG: hypothetical protein BroJett018_27180 [Chloroflexota bacterium]
MDTKPLVSISKERLGGTPVFYGTRVPVHHLVEHLVAGVTIDEFLEDFPSVSREQVIRFLEQGEAHAIEEAYRDND